MFLIITIMYDFLFFIFQIINEKRKINFKRNNVQEKGREWNDTEEVLGSTLCDGVFYSKLLEIQL